MKREKTIEVLRAMAQTCEKTAYWMEQGKLSMAKSIFRIGVLESYLPFLRNRYKEWGDK